MRPKDHDEEEEDTTAERGHVAQSSNTLEDTTTRLLKGSSRALTSTTTAHFELWHELQGLLALAFPSVALQFNMYFIFPQAASTVGRTLGSNELAGFSLGCLVGNITCLSITIGVLAAADTLMPRAYGAGKYTEVGRLLIRSLVVGAVVLTIPIIPMCTVLEPIMLFLGQDPVPAHLAAVWVRYYVLGVPATLLLRTLQRFLVAQSLPWPPVYATTLVALVIFPILIRVLVARSGLVGSAVAVSITQWLMVLFLLAYLRLRPVYKRETWPGLSWCFIREAVRWEKMMEFVNLSLGGVLGLSEWWFWETMCFIAGSFGTVALCAHTIAYNLIPLASMIPLGLSIGTIVRIGQELPTNPQKAKRIAGWSLTLVFIMGCVIAILSFFYRDFVVGLFSNDPAVADACRQIWPFVCLHIIPEYVFYLQAAVMRALAMQWRLGVCISSCLWGILLPVVLWLAVANGGGLKTLWVLCPVGYTAMNTVLRFSYAYIDWNEKSFEAQRKLHLCSTKSGTKHSTEESSLLRKQTESVESA